MNDFQIQGAVSFDLKVAPPYFLNFVIRVRLFD